jgi:serine/threonine-protein kinase
VYGTYLDHIAETDSSRERWTRLQGREPRPYAFWYRESPLPLVPVHPYGNIRFADPPRSIAGMASVVSDDEGRLRILEIVPPQHDTSPANAATPDYSPLFEAAGLRVADFAPVRPEWNPLLSSESRSAWTGRYAGQEEVVRVEAGAYRGRPIYFQVLDSFDRPTREARHDPKPVSKVAAEWAYVVLMLSMLLVPPFVARRNLRRGVGDRRGAWRLGFAVFLLQLASWALRTEAWGSVFKSEMSLVVQLGLALVLGALTALIYLALEPYVRRLWPRSLISWTRLLMGRFGDPRVGRDVLIGAVAGVVVTLAQRLEWLVPWALGVAPRIPYGVAEATLGSGGKALAMAAAPGFLLGPLMVLFVLTTPTLLLRRKRLALAVSMLILVLMAAPWVAQSSSGMALASALVEVVLVYAVLVGTLLRFGLLALAAAFFFFEILQHWPLTFDGGAWYFDTSLMGMAILAVVATLAVIVARGGANVWRRAAVGIATRG